MDKLFKKAISKLANHFEKLNWNFEIDPSGHTHDLISNWLGEPNEEIMVCAFKGKSIDEPFHRQDFFFLNFAYKGSYEALSNQASNRIRIYEGDCYIGQPFSGYAIKGASEEEITILGILIRKDAFYREYFSTLASDDTMFHFFLDAESDQYSDTFIHLHLEKNSLIWSILETMVLEYADKKENTSQILKPLCLAICMLISRELTHSSTKGANSTLSLQIIDYIRTHPQETRLQDIAAYFGYHPNYLSGVIHHQTGKTFSNLLLETRMDKAKLLVTGTSLSIEEIAVLLGYASTSNFYKAYKKYYGTTPRN